VAKEKTMRPERLERRRKKKLRKTLTFPSASQKEPSLEKGVLRGEAATRKGTTAEEEPSEVDVSCGFDEVDEDVEKKGKHEEKRPFRTDGEPHHRRAVAS